MCSGCSRANARIGWSSGALSAIVKARVQYRHRALPALRRATEAHRGHRGCGRHRPPPHASGAGRADATARAGETGGSVSGGVTCKTGLDVDWAGGGVRTALGQTLRWSGIQARCVRKLSARLRESWVFRDCARAFDRSTLNDHRIHSGFLKKGSF